MFTTHRTQVIAATLVAATVGTIGIAAAAADSGSRTTTSAHAVEAVGATEEGATHTSATAPDDDVPSGDVAPAPTAPTTTPSPPVSPVEPDDEVDEPVSPVAPGVIDLVAPVDPPPPPPIGGPTELIPVPKDPTPPPIPGPVDLVTPPPSPDPVIDDFAAPIDPTPFDGPSDFQVVPLPSHLGEITSGLSGCQLECVRSAVLTANDFDPNVHLAIETAVPVHFEIEVTKTGTNSSTFFNNPGYDTEWSTTLSPLQPDTTYDLTLIAIDQDGLSKVYEHRFTTVDVIDGFAGNARGCALQCLTHGEVNRTDSHSKVQVHLTTNTLAAVKVWISTSEPNTVDGVPVLPSESLVHDVSSITNATFDVPGLAADTVYHIVVRAEDSWGVDHQVGSFRTDEEPPTPVSITFEQIHVLYDGDKSWNNRGELAFGWGFDGTAIGTRGEEKMHDNKRIHLGGDHGGIFLLDDGDMTIPEIGVRGTERDWDGLGEFCSAGLGIPSQPSYSASCDTKTNVALLDVDWNLTDIEALPTCASIGEIVGGIGARCVWIGTPNEGDDYARFNVLISFTI